MDQSIRDLFPIVRSRAYLNSAAMAPMPQPAIDAVSGQLCDVASNGAAHVSDWAMTKARVRELIAGLLGVAPATIAFMRNTSDGLCAVAAGIDWTAGDNIVSFEKEFPANYYPWKKVSEDRGVELRLCPERGGRIDLAELCSLVDRRTRLVTLSAVQYHSGFRSDLERVGRIARRNGALFCVDVIQGLGAMEFNLPEQLVDVAAGSSYKWLCSPEGCGIFYLSDQAKEFIKPPSRGWTSVQNAWDFADRDQPLVCDSRAWETGMGGSALFYGVEQSLRMFKDAGMGRIEAYLSGLSALVCEEAVRAGLEIVSSRLPGEKSQIVALRTRDGLDPAGVVRQLADEGVDISSRDGCIRISPHFFNDESDVLRLFECISSILADGVPKRSRRQAHAAFEDPRKVGLVGETTFVGDI